MATWGYETNAATDPTSGPDAVSPRLINKTSLDQGKVPDDWKQQKLNGELLQTFPHIHLKQSTRGHCTQQCH